MTCGLLKAPIQNANSGAASNKLRAALIIHCSLPDVNMLHHPSMQVKREIVQILWFSTIQLSSKL